MFGRLFRVLIGFTAACLGAAFTMILFVHTPAGLGWLELDAAWPLMLTVNVAVEMALFSAPFALAVAAFGEIRAYRDWAFYAVLGLVVAGFGFFSRHSVELLGQQMIVGNYSLIAFMTSGFVGGLIYWLLSGRFAGNPPGTPTAGLS